jgi:hypothetical protein
MENDNDGYQHAGGAGAPDPGAIDQAPEANDQAQAPVLNIITPGTVRMEKYDGTRSWTSFKNQFERVAVMNNWENRAQYLWIHLEGDALLYMDAMPGAETMTYEELCECIKQRFSTERLSNLQKAKLLNRRRLPGENLSQFGQAIRQLVNGAYPAFPIDAKEEMSIEKFLDALHPELRRSVYQRSPTTLTEAIEEGLKLEAWGLVEEKKHGQRAAIRLTADPDDNVPETENVRLLKDLHDKMEALTQRSPRESKRTLKCFYCDKAGHFARECYKKKRDEATKETGSKPPRSTVTCHRCGGRGPASDVCASPSEN